MRSANVTTVIKILISTLLLLIAVYTAATSGPLFETLANTPVWILVVAILIYAAGQTLSCLKWWLLLKTSGISVSFSTTSKAYFMGMFVNCFGLGVVGGDVARALLLGTNQKAQALASVAADRVHGLTILSMVGAVGGWVLLLSDKFTQDHIFLWVLTGLTVGLTIGWFFAPFFLSLIPGQHKIIIKIRGISNSFPKNPIFLIGGSLISIIFHLSQILLYYLMGRAFGISIPAEFLFVSVPMVNIASTLPISWNGLGIREYGLSSLLAPAISATQAVAFGAIWLMAVMVTSCIGGILAFYRKDFKTVISNRSELN